MVMPANYCPPRLENGWVSFHSPASWPQPALSSSLLSTPNPKSALVMRAVMRAAATLNAQNIGAVTVAAAGADAWQHVARSNCPRQPGVKAPARLHRHDGAGLHQRRQPRPTAHRGDLEPADRATSATVAHPQNSPCATALPLPVAMSKIHPAQRPSFRVAIARNDAQQSGIMAPVANPRNKRHSPLKETQKLLRPSRARLPAQSERSATALRFALLRFAPPLRRETPRLLRPQTPTVTIITGSPRRSLLPKNHSKMPVSHRRKRVTFGRSFQR
jgi:hypothetical protein